MKVYGELMEHGEVVPHPKVVVEGDELARRFIVRTSARGAASEAIRRAVATFSRPVKMFEPGTLCFFHRHYPGKRAETAMRGRYLGPAVLIGPHGRSSWWVLFAGRAHLCATEHLRGVTPWTKEASWQDVSLFGRPREEPLPKRSGEQLPRFPGQ